MSVRARPSARMPSCVVVARGTLNPLALVRIQARQPDHSRVAQLVERAAVNRLVVGSSPTSGANLIVDTLTPNIGRKEFDNGYN